MGYCFDEVKLVCKCPTMTKNDIKSWSNLFDKFNDYKIKVSDAHRKLSTVALLKMTMIENDIRCAELKHKEAIKKTY
jgi:quinolinate synthase